MKTKDIIITLILSITIVILYIVNEYTKVELEYADTAYQVYLNGEVIGLIEDDASLYNLINNEQQAIKNEYNVDNVYPPNVFEIVETKTFNKDYATPESIYQMIEERDDFTIRGYTITVRYNEEDYYEEEEVPEDFVINVLDVDVFNEAIESFILAFVSLNDYNDYINNEIEELTDIGQVITNMYFQEQIMIKESFISVNDKIYTDSAELAQDLLFGVDAEMDTYTVEAGDSIESISEEFELNPQEFLIANPNYKSEDTILRVGDEVNVTLIDPQITFVYELYEVSDEVVYYERETVRDNSKPVGYSEVTTAGRNGIERYRETYTVTNGVRSQEADVELLATIQEVQNQITTVGPSRGGSISDYRDPVNLNGAWAWPTNRGYVITSYRGWRWGRMHQGIDISGAGNFGSSIYAAAGGTVTYVNNTCPSQGRGYGDSCGGAMGNEVVIDHGNGYVTRYGHLHQTVLVRVGQTVSRGDRIGYMGNSGSSTGAHLHFEVLYNGSNINPLGIYQ